MFKIGKKKTESLSVSIDIGTQYIKIVAINKTDQGISINNYKVLNLVSDGKRFLQKEISQLIKKSITEMTLSPKFVKSSISGKSLIVRHVELPKMTLRELKSSLKYQADMHIPFSLDEAFYDAFILNNAPVSSGANKMKVLITAVKKIDADDVISTIKKAGYFIDMLTVDSVALFNAFEYGMTESEKKETIALIDIGASKTNINIVDKGVSHLCREIKYGGIKVTEMLMENFNMPFDKAEEKKLAGDEAILPLAIESFKPLVRDARASFDYFEGMVGASVQKVYLSGGGALTRGLIDYLKEKLGAQVLLWNPLRKFDDTALQPKDKEFLISNSSLLTVGLGIAMSIPEGA
jgi:type IV pilus assembly protein PilM